MRSDRSSQSAANKSAVHVAIVTGASSGMGMEYAHELSKQPDVDEIWLVARRRDRLEKLAAEISCAARIICADLTSGDDIEKIDRELEKRHPSVSYLVSAAGFGKFGTWDTIPASANDAMIDLNCKAMVHITTVVLPYMGRGSHVLEIVSCSAFTPLPHLNVYASTKAFMQSYVRALRWEVRKRGICVTAVCPGWVKTEFMKHAETTGHDVRHYIGAQKPRTVVRRSILANKCHFAIATCGVGAFVLRIVGKFLPHCITMAGWEGVRRL